MPVGHTHRRYRGIHVIDSGLNGLKVGGRRHACGGMALHMNGYVQTLFQTAYQLKGGIGLKQASHVLNAQTVCAHIFYLPAQIEPKLQGVDGADGVGDRALSMLPRR